MAKITMTAGKQAADTLMWIRWAEADYLGARMLLLGDLLVQGGALSNTAIEKYLKAVCRHSGMKIPHRHEVDRLYDTIKSQTVKHELDLNIDYLKLLSKVYKLRYPDDLEVGFNISLNQAKLITQLDRSVQELTTRFRIVHAGKPVLMVLDQAKQDNYVRISTAMSSSIRPKVACYFQIRVVVMSLGTIGTAFCRRITTLCPAKDDLIFDAPGMAPNPTNSRTSISLISQPRRRASYWGGQVAQRTPYAGCLPLPRHL